MAGLKSVALLLFGVVVVAYGQHHHGVGHHYVAPHYIERQQAYNPYYIHHTPPIDPHSKYAFGYSVHDPYTGLPHNRVEEKDGPVVKGAYQVVENDGSLRTVTYSTDPVHGFQAVVDKGPLPVRDLIFKRI